MVFGGSRLVRAWSRAHEQENVVHSVQMEVMALAYATLQRCDAQGLNGYAAASAVPNGMSAQNDARAALRKNVSLLKDDTLRQITRDLLDCTGRLSARSQPAEVARVRDEVRSLQARFRVRSDEVQRDMRLGRR
jgi:hypothetical protein